MTDEEKQMTVASALHILETNIDVMEGEAWEAEDIYLCREAVKRLAEEIIDQEKAEAELAAVTAEGERVCEENGRLACDLRATIVQLEKVEAELAAVTAELKSLTYCAYCGAEFPCDGDTEDISDHIKTCPDHPMRGVEKERDTAVKLKGRYVDKLKDCREEKESWKLSYESSEAVLAMTVARLEGLVEGHPTQRHNFLQRIDELVQTEAERDRLREALERIQLYRVGDTEHTKKILQITKDALSGGHGVQESSCPTPNSIDWKIPVSILEGTIDWIQRECDFEQEDVILFSEAIGMVKAIGKERDALSGGQGGQETRCVDEQGYEENPCPTCKRIGSDEDA